MKKILFMAAAALALASCSSESDLAGDVTQNDGNVAVSFADPYLGGTRATVIGTSNFENFGVYAYEQGTTAWDTYRSSNVYPNFFYNQDVTKQSDGSWTYSPVKYFSNNQGAKHSFFVYAPYNASNNAIFSMANDAPVIRYSAKEDYDLLWAPAIIDKVKPGVNEKLAFHFQHALSKVSFDVAPFIDEVHGTHNDGTVAAGTTITVRSVKFTGKVPSQGLLNLRDGKWTIEATEEGAYEITEPVSFDNSDNGATDHPKRKDLISNMMVIPANGVKVKVVYDVTTVDETNPKNNSTVTNTVESEGSFNLLKGTAYKFHLDLGLTSVKFTADVVDWPAETNEVVDLPNNVYTVTKMTIDHTSVETGTSLPTSSPTTGDLFIMTNSGYHFYKYGTSEWELQSSFTGYVTDESSNYYYFENGNCTSALTVNSASTVAELSTKAQGYYLVSGELYKVE